MAKILKAITGNKIIRQKGLRNVLIVSTLLATSLPAYMILVLQPSYTGVLIDSVRESAIRVANHLKSLSVHHHTEISKAVLQDQFLSNVGNIIKDIQLERLKIYSKSGEIIFSSNPEDIGIINKQVYFHDIVGRGKTLTQIIEKNETTLEGRNASRSLVETYVPIMDGDRFQGAIEIYYDISDLKAGLDKLVTRSSILLLILAFGLLSIVIITVFKENKILTSRQRAEQALQKAHQDLKFKAAELQEVNSELSQYAHVVSHDLQAPLRAINNYVSFLKDDLASSLKSEQAQYLDAIARTGNKAAELVNDLLELSRIGQKTISIESIRTGTFLKETIDSLSLPAEVIIAMTEDWPTIEAEPVLLRQIFQNLIENAVKFNTSQNKLVELGWREKAPGIYEFRVSDNGIGIEPGHREKIFRVFGRLHTTEEYEGTGVGLAIVRKALGKLGGTIRVESNTGRGSTFFFTIPKTQDKR